MSHTVTLTYSVNRTIGYNRLVFSSPGQSPGRAVVVPSALALVLAAALAKC